MGRGFTEWANVARGLPRFAGHYQPRIPRDLGHYRLDDPSVLPRQAAMAQEAGIVGFVFYFYWFNGTRLLERPLEAFLADRSIDMPFCLMWANENWTRRWDGSDERGADLAGLPRRRRAGADRDLRPPLRRSALHPPRAAGRC